MSEAHAAVWIDHEQARIFALSRDTASKWTVKPRGTHAHHHGGGGDHRDGNPLPDGHYFHSVADAIRSAGEVLIVGPGLAKHELMRHLSNHDPDVATKIVGVETMDHPSDGEIVKFARKYFRAADRMR